MLDLIRSSACYILPLWFGADNTQSTGARELVHNHTIFLLELCDVVLDYFHLNCGLSLFSIFLVTATIFLFAYVLVFRVLIQAPHVFEDQATVCANIISLVTMFIPEVLS